MHKNRKTASRRRTLAISPAYEEKWPDRLRDYRIPRSLFKLKQETLSAVVLLIFILGSHRQPLQQTSPVAALYERRGSFRLAVQAAATEAITPFICQINNFAVHDFAEIEIEPVVIDRRYNTGLSIHWNKPRCSGDDGC